MIKTIIKEKLFYNMPLDDNKKNLVDHGIDILISDIRNFLFVYFLSFLIHNSSHALLYMLVLSTLRVHTGGWHASSELKCFISYQGMFLLFSILNSFNIPFFIDVAFIVVSILYILSNAPVEHRLNPLSRNERKINRAWCIFYCFLYSMIFIFLIYRSPSYSQTIAISFVFNIVLMWLLKRKGDYRYYED